MNGIILIIVVLVITDAVTSSQNQPKIIEVECYSDAFNHLNCITSNTKVFQCKYKSPDISEKAMEISVKMNTTKEPPEKVLGLKIENVTMHYFPRGFDKSLKNVIGLIVNKTQLKEIKMEDLRQFPNLKVLDLCQNEIKFIEYNLFRNNPNLTALYMYSNLIKFIDPESYLSLKNLTDVSFYNNTCTSALETEYKKNETKKNKFNYKVFKDCFTPKQQLEHRIEKVVRELDEIREKIKPEVKYYREVNAAISNFIAEKQKFENLAAEEAGDVEALRGHSRDKMINLTAEIRSEMEKINAKVSQQINLDRIKDFNEHFFANFEKAKLEIKELELEIRKYNKELHSSSIDLKLDHCQIIPQTPVFDEVYGLVVNVFKPSNYSIKSGGDLNELICEILNQNTKLVRTMETYMLINGMGTTLAVLIFVLFLVRRLLSIRREPQSDSSDTQPAVNDGEPIYDYMSNGINSNNSMVQDFLSNSQSTDHIVVESDLYDEIPAHCRGNEEPADPIYAEVNKSLKKRK